jgi:micrococcal nuclease
VESVVDGDTVRVTGGETIRILGVNTPEIGYGGDPDECWAQQARSFTNSSLHGARVWLTFDGDCTDAYSRTLAYLHTGTAEDGFFDWLLLREGHARVLVIEPNSTFRSEFYAAQALAQSEDLGLWGTCQ